MQGSIQKLRLQYGWSQAQLAELCGLSTRTIQRIERGQTPSPETLKALGAVFGINFLEPAEAREAEGKMTELSKTVAAEHLRRREEEMAFAHVRCVKGFYSHLTTYVIVNCALAAINLISNPHHIWFIWPLMGWGIGVLTHAVRVFNVMPFCGPEWEKRQVEKYLGRKL